MTGLRIAIHVRESAGISRAFADVRLGVPLPRGLVDTTQDLTVVDPQGRALLCQFDELARWPDRSLKWILVDFLVPCAAHVTTTVYLVDRGVLRDAIAESGSAIHVEHEAGAIRVQRGGWVFQMPAAGTSLLTAIGPDQGPVLDAGGLNLGLSLPDGTTRLAEIASIEVERGGPVRADIVTTGRIAGRGGKSLDFRARWSFVAGVEGVQCDLMVRNPEPARHVGGLWDLGDDGSFLIRDLSLRLVPMTAPDRVAWYAEEPGGLVASDVGPLCIYQDSSGGERWDSPNHRDASGRLGVVFRGYEVRAGAAPAAQVIARGHRAQPLLSVEGRSGRIAASVRDFWQNFPKALRWEASSLSIGLFPRERIAAIELQGGEQKRHRVLLEFAGSSVPASFAAMANPVHAWVDPQWVESSGAVPGFVSSLESRNEYLDYINRIVEGERSFMARRELIDEYGWRNFGDLYADHEAVHSDGSEPFVSHYNNQYDFIHGAGHHGMRTGDRRWWQLMDEAARHTVDIDVYHTREDKPASNGGLFWHTDHYKPAATASHRTYSQANRTGGDYGGGPSNEHNYTSGLTLHFYLTGDPDSREAVIGLADWVLAMDDGSHTLLGLLDSGPTGLASKTQAASYHGPGRGAGNSINALLDGYALTGHRRYMVKAEELIQRCVHPRDEIDSLQLDEPEYRWSYLVFLQVLGRYLGTKIGLGESDYGFQYARESLLHYARWMLVHERPYRELLHKVLLPTETWPAHDIRKCHVFHLAARYDGGARADEFRLRADWFYDRCLADLLSFETADLTRPLVILCVYGYLQEYFHRYEDPVPGRASFGTHGYEFGQPGVFVPQRERALGAFKSRVAATANEVRRLSIDRLGRWRQVVLGRRA